MDANSSGASEGSKAPDPATAGGSGEQAARLQLSAAQRLLRGQAAALAREERRAAGLAAQLRAREAGADLQATALLRALLTLEAGLRREQAQIVKRLRDKDVLLKKQRVEIEALRQGGGQYCRSCQQLMGFTSEQTNIETDPEFHSLESAESHNRKVFERSMSYHEKQQPFQKNSRLCKSFNSFAKENVKGDNTSSSEEVFESGDAGAAKGTFVKNKQAFVRKDVTRRSRKFSGRKHSSAYLETVQRRHSRSQASSSSAEDGPQSEKDTKFRLNHDENLDIGSEISKDIARATNRIDQLRNRSNSSDKDMYNDSLELRLHGRNGRESTFSGKIDSLHGIRKPLSDDRLSIYQSDRKNSDINGDSEKAWYTNCSDQEPEVENHYVSKDRVSYQRSMSADDVLMANDDPKESKTRRISTAEGMTSKSEKLRSVTKLNNENSKERHPHNEVTTNGCLHPRYKNNVEGVTDKSHYGTNGKFDNEPNENWYASASDPDDDPSCEIYKNNPVLECVNQILLQNSLDENSSDGARVYESVSPKSSTKRVQFSTLNSISFDESVGKNGQSCSNSLPRDMHRHSDKRNNKIVKFSLETASEHSYEVPITLEGFNYEVQSIYSNDYEPIITKPTEVQDMNLQNVKLKPVPLPRTMNNINKANNEATSPKKNSIVKNMALGFENKINNNHYVDMETKFGTLPGAMNKKKVPRVPPALPPKPKNLVSKFKLNNVTHSNGASSLPPNINVNSDTVVSNQRTNDVQIAPAKNSNKSCATAEPDYCSISEINVPVVSSGKRGLILSQATVEIHAEKFSPNIAEKRFPVAKLATISKITPNKITDKDIPKLPQVTEIIIPDDEEVKEIIPQRNSHDNYGSNPQHGISNNGKMDLRNSIQMGHSVSTILTDIKNRNVSMEDVNKCIMSPENGRQYPISPPNKSNTESANNRISIKMADKTRLDLAIFEAVENDCEKFDLSQNFEEFKIDDCEFTNLAAEEYRISSASDGSSTDSVNDEANSNAAKTTDASKVSDTLQLRNPTEGIYRIEFTAEDDLNARNLVSEATVDPNDPTSKGSLKNYSKLSNKPDLLSNIDNIETDSVRYSDLESSNSSSSNCGSYNTVKCEPSTFAKEATSAKLEQKNVLPFEYFLESSGLSSKSILTPSRPPSSNHKSVLKPKDIKMRSKNTTNIGRTPLYEKCGNTAIKYFEPYL